VRPSSSRWLALPDASGRFSPEMPLIRKSALAGPSASTDAGNALAMLRSGDPDQRWSAARGVALVPAAVDALRAALASEPDTRVREAIFTSLVRIGTRESVDAVLPLLRSDDASSRTGALDALRAMIGAVRPFLPDLLADGDPDVRLLICDLVREVPAEEATRLLCAVVERELEVNVCAAAVDVLGDFGEAAALPSLMRCAARFGDDPFIAFAVRLATERIVAERA
jgi:HEAT repeat protein